MKIHHVAYLVKKLKNSEEEFVKLGFEVEKPVKYDHVRDVNISFMVNDGYRVELVEPASKESPLYPLLKNYKNSPYHMCYIVKDLEASKKELENDGYMLIKDTEVAPCLEDRNVVFLINPYIGMIELVEEEK